MLRTSRPFSQPSNPVANLLTQPMLQLVVLSCLISGLPSLAKAQYDPSSQPGYELAPAVGDRRLSRIGDDPLLAMASDLMQCEMFYLCKIEPGMARRLSRDGDEIMIFDEAPGGPVPHEYHIKGQPIFVGVGAAKEDHFSLGFGVYSFVLTRDGQLKLVDLFVPKAWLGPLFILDLSKNGLTEIAFAASSGLGSSSGVYTLQIQADGSLTPLGFDEYTSFRTYYCHFELLDFDHDGVWEIEIKHAISWAGCEYFVTELTTFDQENGEWILGEGMFSEYYRPQFEFYEEFLLVFREYCLDFEKYKVDLSGDECWYPIEIDGQQYDMG